MSYSVATHFDQTSWDQYGPNWLRKAKSEGLKGVVYGLDLSESAQNKISSMGFRHFDIKDNQRLNFNCGDTDVLLTRFDTEPLGGLSQGNVVCFVSELTPIDIVWSISTLQDRARVIRLLEKKPIYSPRFVLGSKKFWTDLSNFMNYIQSQNFLDSFVMREELLFNLYLMFFKIEVEVKEND